MPKTTASFSRVTVDRRLRQGRQEHQGTGIGTLADSSGHACHACMFQSIVLCLPGLTIYSSDARRREREG